MSDETILGVDREIVERALTLMRDKYHLATEANTFLETRTGVSGISISITNQRDAITHLISLLKTPTAPRDAQIEQLANLKEHLRRACMEPYETAVNLTMVNLDKIKQQYCERVLTLSNLQSEIPSAPSLQEISTIIAAAAKRRMDGRLAKTLNDWTPEWEAGLKDFILCFEDLFALQTRLETYLGRADQIRAGGEIAKAAAELERVKANAARDSKAATRLAWILCGIGLIGGVILAMSWDYIKTWYHLF